ncbi:MAG: 16S rRNA (guanine(966)-N(2))-methyltransferase RsmD [Sneathiella sp.]
MRIVSGEFRGKLLAIPEDKRIRPTADRIREALFNILAHGTDYLTDNGPLPRGARVLDMFAGTGALGVEALSRGAEHVTFMDNNPESLKLIRQNVAAINAQHKSNIYSRNGTNLGRNGSAVDLILMDPPYSQDLAVPCLEGLLAGGWCYEKTVIVLELATKDKFEAPEGFEVMDERKYGSTKLYFLGIKAPAND